MRDVLETCSTASAPFYVARWTLRRGHTSLIAAFAPASRVLSLVLAWMPHGYVLLPELLLRGVARMCMRHVRVEEIADGNVNFSFAVRGRFGRALFVKQARGFLKWQPQMALERERMAREVQYFKDAAAALGDGAMARRFLPMIHDFDEENTTLFMDFLEGFTVLFEQLFRSGVIARGAAEGLGEYCARVASRTLAPAGGTAGVLPTADAARRAVDYWNPSLRAIQLEHVYTICFRESERGRELARDARLMAEVGVLKAKYLGYSFDARDRFALCHGDLHPGGVMVCGADVKIIDPEFAAFAPPGLDLGSLFSGFVLAHIYYALGLAHEGDAAPRDAGSLSSAPAAAALQGIGLKEALVSIWSVYERQLAADGVEREQIERIAEDTVGYASMEVLRTALGFAGARDPARRIAHPQDLARYQEAAVILVRNCLLGRVGGGVHLLFAQMEALRK